MRFDNYLQSGESVLCETRAQRKNSSSPGNLAVTDTRVIFTENKLFSDNRVLDIDLHQITEIEHRTNPINYTYLIFGSLSLLFGLLFFALGSTPVPDSLWIFFVVLLILFGLISLGVALISSETLILRTASQTHVFKKGNFERFPHAIRGTVTSQRSN